VIEPSHRSARVQSTSESHPARIDQRSRATLPSLLAHIAGLSTCALILISAGQPLMTDDLWMHLALGEVYSESGIPLTTDPHLYAAPGPPAPTSWLADLTLYRASQVFGFNGLRILHVAMVAMIFALAWLALRRAAGSAAFASLSVALFGAVSAYRLIQLRPELGTIGLLLVLHLLVFAPDSRLVRWKMALVALLCVVWVNIHAAFLLGPILLIGVSISLAVVAWLCLEGSRRAALLDRARFLALTGGVSAIATLCNPQGFAAHTAYWSAGTDTPDLRIVSDEWRRVDLFDLPAPNLPPSWLSWFSIWALLIAVMLLVGFALRRLRVPEIEARVDPGLLALASAALIGISIAARFLWLSIFCLLLLGYWLRDPIARSLAWRTRIAWASAITALALIPAFWSFGDWPMISRALGQPLSDFSRPYPAEKYYGHAVWMLRDAGLEGNLYNKYSMGGFLSFWLSPRLKMSSSGSMNIRRESFDAQIALGRRIAPPRIRPPIWNEPRVGSRSFAISTAQSTCERISETAQIWIASRPTTTTRAYPSTPPSDSIPNERSNRPPAGPSPTESSRTTLVPYLRPSDGACAASHRINNRLPCSTALPPSTPHWDSIGRCW